MKKDEIIFHQWDDADVFYILYDGSIDIYLEEDEKNNGDEIKNKVNLYIYKYVPFPYQSRSFQW